MSAVTVGARDLADALHNVLPHTSTDKTLPALTALIVTAEPQGLVIAATDRYTLAEQTVPYRGGDDPAATGHLMITGDEARDLLRLANRDVKKDERPVWIVQLAHAYPSVTTDGNIISLSDPDWEPPRYRSLFPGRGTQPAKPERITTFGIGAKHLAKYADLRLHGSKSPKNHELRVELGATATRPLLVRPLALEAAGVAFRSLVMPVRLGD